MTNLDKYLSKLVGVNSGYYHLHGISFIVIGIEITYLEIPDTLAKYSTNPEVIVALNRINTIWPQHVEGPVSVSRHESKEFGMTIYIFGDIHKILKACPSENKQRIDHFLKMVSDTNLHKMIDIFYEYDLDVDNKPASRDQCYFGYVDNTWGHCLSKNKLACPRNIRFHYADARSYRKKRLDKLMYRYQLLGQMTSRSLIKNGNFDRNKFDKIYRWILNNKDRITQFINNIESAQNSKIAKQLDNIPEDYIRERIELIVRNGKKQTLDILNNAIQSGREINEAISVNPIDTKKIGASRKLLMMSETLPWIMDAYLLARLFRRYKDGYKSKYIIIYAGDIHCRTYRKFLSKLNFTMTCHESNFKLTTMRRHFSDAKIFLLITLCKVITMFLDLHHSPWN